MTLEDRLQSGASSLNELTLQVEVDPSSPGNRNRRRNRALASMAALLLVAGVGVGAVLLRDDPNVSDEVTTELDDDEPEPDLETVEDPKELDMPDLAAAVPAGPRDGAASFRFPIQVDPGENLADGDTVTVKGRGFSPNTQVGMVQCWIGGSDGSIDDCDIGTPHLFSTDGSGGFTETLTVRRYIEVRGEQVDCAAQTLEIRCVLGAGELSNYDRSGAAILHFAPDDPVPTPQLAVSETAALTHGQVVTVTGEGFPPGDPVEIHQCVLGGFDTKEVCGQITASWIVEADGDGTFETGITVNRTVQSVDGVVDCADVTCYVFAASVTPTAPVALSFESGGEVPEGQSVTAAGNGLLKEGQTIRIDGQDMLVDGDVRVLQCTQSGYCEDIGETTVAGGTTSVTVPVKRVLWQPNVGQVDCAEERCDVVGWMSGVKVWTIELDFDPSVPPPAGPTLNVTPNEALRDGDVVTLSVTGVPASAEDYGFWYRQCTPNQSSCSERTYLTDSVVETGSTQQFDVRRLIYDYNQAAAVDCAEVECRIFVDAAGTVLSTKLNFDPSVAAPELPSLTVTPSVDLIDGQDVTITTGSAITSPYVALCSTNPATGKQCISVVANEFGENQLVIPAYRTFTDSLGEAVDCVATACHFEVWDQSGFPLTGEIGFDPDAAQVPPAEVQLPDGPFQHGQEVTVTISNFRGSSIDRYESVDLASGDVAATTAESGRVGASLCAPDLSGCAEILVRNETASGFTFKAARLIPDYESAVGGSWLDCVDVGCVLIVQTMVDRVVTPFAFDPNQAAPEAPRIVVDTAGLGQGPISLDVTVEGYPDISSGWWADVCSDNWCAAVPGLDEPVSLSANESADCLKNGCTIYVYHQEWPTFVPELRIGGSN